MKKAVGAINATCPFCNGSGHIILSFSALPKTERDILVALSGGEEMQAGDLPNPGSTQRMACKRLEEKGLILSRVVSRELSPRNHRYGYQLTAAGKAMVGR